MTRSRKVNPYDVYIPVLRRESAQVVRDTVIAHRGLSVRTRDNGWIGKEYVFTSYVNALGLLDYMALSAEAAQEQKLKMAQANVERVRALEREYEATG